MCKKSICLIFVVLVMLLNVGLSQAAAPVGSTISLFSTFTGYYVEMDPGRDNGLIALDSTSVGIYEEFIVEDAGGGNILLKSVANSMYARADVEAASPVNVLRAETTSTSDTLAHYEWVDNGDGTISLRCIGNAKYIKVQGASLYLKATLASIGPDALFTVEILVAAAQASEPYPVNGAAGVNIDADLSWTAGASATSHDVYFGTDATPDAGEFIGNQSGTTYDPGTLDLGTTYYWQIDEVDTGDPESPWIGNVWSFTTSTGTAVLKKGPYLLYPNNNDQMTVLWQLDSGESCSIDWGLDTSYSDGSAGVSDFGSDYQYKYTITGLTPGAKYYYKVTVGAGFSVGSFTAAPSNSATDVKFLMYGDTRTNAGDHDTTCGGMNATIVSDPAYQTFTLHSGDWVQTGDDESNWTDQFFNRNSTEAMQMMGSIAIQGCRGNHGGSGGLIRKYWPYNYVNSNYYSFDYGPVHVSVIDQYTSWTSGSAQYNWLVNDLATTNKTWKIVMLHHPGWSAGNHPNDTDVQNDIQPLCLQYGVQIVLAGHNHYYARALVDGVHHVTSGGGGAPRYTTHGGDYIVVDIETLNYSTVDISGNTMISTAYQPDGTVIDSFTVVASECGDQTCDPGEECNCPSDCGSPPSSETSCTDGFDNDCDSDVDCDDADCNSDPACLCGNGTCDPGEDCNSCSEDCISKTGGKPSSRYCCGDGTCEGAEDQTNCAVDCGGGGSYCDDGTCDPGEDQCNCSEDCGTPPSTETTCDDGIDEDCDSDTDCDDADCLGDPACPTCGDATCDTGEDQCNCPGDCGTPPSTETNCTDGINEDCDADTDCDDSDCADDPACEACGAKGEPCSDDADCCSTCNTRKGTCK